jgi:hypothetical protein
MDRLTTLDMPLNPAHGADGFTWKKQLSIDELESSIISRCEMAKLGPNTGEAGKGWIAP